MIEALIFLSKVFLSALFLIAGLGKLRDLEGKNFEDLGFSKESSIALTLLLSILEIAVAFGLIFSQTAYLASLAALLLLVVFTLFLGYQLKKGYSGSCNCFGSLYRESISPKSLIRNFLFAIPAVFLVSQKQATQNLDFFQLSFEISLAALFGIGIIVLLGFICFYLKQVLSNQVKIIRQLEILGAIGATEIERQIEGVKHPEQGLPIGAPVPSFSLESLEGELVDSSKIFSTQKSTLLVFVNPLCKPCNILMPELLDWQNRLEEKIDLVFISTGEKAENKKKFGSLSGKIFLQRNEEVSGLFGIQWTPVALLVNKDRRIASKVAAGDASIRALLERISRAQEAYFIVDEDSGVVVGQSIPDFELPKLDEGKISSREFLGRKTLLTYWSPTCGFCNEMLEDLKGWNRNKGADDPELVIISASKDAGEKIKADFDSLILIDEKHQLLGKLGMQGTPSAVLIDEGGRIISEVAVGAQKIWELLGVRKNGHFEI